MRQRGKRGERQGKKADPRPFVRDAGRDVQGPLDAATVTGGMVLLALAVGFVLGLTVFALMRLSGWLTGLIWNGYLAGDVQLAWFPLVVCAAGGLVIGLWTHFSGDHVKPLHEVMAEFKATGSYRTHPVKGAISFLLPLIFGGSVGFEAGLTGLIAAGCCWIRDRLKAAGLRVGAIADVTIAASMSAIFGAPFAGIVAGAESTPESDDEASVHGETGSQYRAEIQDAKKSRISSSGYNLDPDRYNMRRGAKIVLYTAAAFGAFAGVRALSSLLGASSGLPHFGEIEAQGADFLWIVAALVCAYALTWIYHGSQFLFSRISLRLGDGATSTIVKPVVAGLAMGAVACALPYVLFPGEEQSHLLMESWTAWAWLALIATGALKAAITPMCLEMGWIGGNFFPSIFAGAAAGYGMAALTGADPMLMVTVTVSAFLAGVMRAPLLTVAILFLVFPAGSVVWMGLAAVVGAALPLPKALVDSTESK